MNCVCLACNRFRVSEDKGLGVILETARDCEACGAPLSQATVCAVEREDVDAIRRVIPNPAPPKRRPVPPRYALASLASVLALLPDLPLIDPEPRKAILEPAALGSLRAELAAWDRPLSEASRAGLREGIASAQRGEIVTLGDFRPYARHVRDAETSRVQALRTARNAKMARRDARARKAGRLP